MSRCFQCGGYGHRPQPAVPKDPQPLLVSAGSLKCVQCGDSLADHQMFGRCYPFGHLEQASQVVFEGRNVAV